MGIWRRDREEALERERERMMRTLRSYGIRDSRILAAMEAVPRHRFIPGTTLREAYGDHPIPIGHGQTISQPYIVARMIELAQVRSGSRVLDVGTGSGYQAAVLAEMGAQVHGIEIVSALVTRAQRLLTELGHIRVEVRYGDGYRGWVEEAPFDTIIVAAAPPHTPPLLLDQLVVGGRLIIPEGPAHGVQALMVHEREDVDSVRSWQDTSVCFVPMTGEITDPGG